MSISIETVEEPRHTMLKVTGRIERGADLGALSSHFGAVPPSRPVLLELTELESIGRFSMRRLRRMVDDERQRRSVAVTSSKLEDRIAIERAGLRGAFPPIAV